VAVVLFCHDFFTSTYCSDEAKLVAKEAINGRLIYLPVFFTATPTDVKEMAQTAWGKGLSAQVDKVWCAEMCAAVRLVVKAVHSYGSWAH
jgi:hypothetical protein